MNFIKNNIKLKPLFLLDNRVDFLLFILVSILILFSIVFSYSLSVYTVVYYDYNEFHFFIRQLLFGILSIFIMILLSNIQAAKIVGNLGIFLFIFFLFIMLIMPFLPSSLVTQSGGATRWIRLGILSLSPIEFFKLGFIYFLSWSFYRRVIDKPKKMLWKDEMLLILPYFVTFLLIVFIVAFMQKDFGQVVLMGLVLLILLIFANRSIKFFFSLIAISLFGFFILIISVPHRVQRIQSWWSMVQDSILSFMPDILANKLRVDTFPEPYQVSHSLNAIYNGSIFGEGIGEGFIKMGFLSDIHTDFILSGIIEELGFLGFLFIIIIFFMIVWRIFSISARIKDPIYHLFTLGIGLMFIISFIINSYGITGIMPIKGIAVPFLSYGGSALISSCIAIGLVLSISKDIKNDYDDEVIK